MDEEFNKYRSTRDFTLYLENTKIADFEYRFDELIKFLEKWKTYYPINEKRQYPIDEKRRMDAKKALEVLWHPITRPYTVYGRWCAKGLTKEA